MDSEVRLLSKGVRVDTNREIEFGCLRCGAVWRQPEWALYARQSGMTLQWRTICPQCGLVIEGGEKKV